MNPGPGSLRELPRAIGRPVNAVLARAGLAVVRRSTFERVVAEWDVPAPEPVSELPPRAGTELRADHPRVLELAARYENHPAAAHSRWSPQFVRREVVLPNFRADNAYVWQSRERNGPARYALTAFYVKDHDPLSLLGRLGEDGLFGAYTVEVDGVRVSRDLLDSILELSFLEEELGLSHLGEITLLDIGAGYGRLAHRATEALPNVTCICADAIPISTYLCEYYLRFRGVRRAEVAPLDRVGAALEKRHVDIAVSVHSFSEAPLESIAWWLDLIAENGVSYLMIVPTKGTQLVSTERSGAREYLPLLTSRGFELVACRPKYAHSPAAQEWGVFPTHHLLFRRR